MDIKERGHVQRGFKAQTARAHRFEQKRHPDRDNGADHNPITEQSAQFIPEDVRGDGATVKTQTQRARERHYQHPLGMEAISQNRLTATHE